MQIKKFGMNGLIGYLHRTKLWLSNQKSIIKKGAKNAYFYDLIIRIKFIATFAII
jgi:hypothetical protein